SNPGCATRTPTAQLSAWGIPSALQAGGLGATSVPISPSERWTFRCCGSCTGALSPSLVASSHDCPWYEKTFGGSRKRSGGILASYGDITVFFSCLTVGYPTSNEAVSLPSWWGLLFFCRGRHSADATLRRRTSDWP